MLRDANLALISLPGRFAAAEAMKALKNGLNVMLYSDNVATEDEIKLKHYADRNDLIVMGPDCGTAVINGKGLGFSNVCPEGPVGIVAASGTGLQEVMVQLSRRGIGVKHGIGTGGRDVKECVGGISFLKGIRELSDDPEISLIVLFALWGMIAGKTKIECIIRQSSRNVPSLQRRFLMAKRCQLRGTS